MHRLAAEASPKWLVIKQRLAAEMDGGIMQADGIVRKQSVGETGWKKETKSLIALELPILDDWEEVDYKHFDHIHAML